MSIEHILRKGVSDFSFIIGTGLKYGGAFGLFSMAVIGTVAVDVVLLAVAEHHHDSFLTGFVIGSMFSRSYMDPVPLLIASPITSIIAVALSFALGVPGVGLALLAGWIISAATLALGMGLEALATIMAPDLVSEDEAEVASLQPGFC